MPARCTCAENAHIILHRVNVLWLKNIVFSSPFLSLPKSSKNKHDALCLCKRVHTATQNAIYAPHWNHNQTNLGRYTKFFLKLNTQHLTKITYKPTQDNKRNTKGRQHPKAFFSAPVYQMNKQPPLAPTHAERTIWRSHTKQ